ncbi:MAG TPA: MFS transporter [Nocardioidaceae bacterium]|nr:MFS transporter [Nocardioidaceae bacterium]
MLVSGRVREVHAGGSRFRRHASSLPDITEAAAPPPTRLRDNRDFKVLLVGQSASALGDAVSVTAMPLVVLALTGSGTLLGVVAALELLPALLLGLPSGALADRLDKRTLLIWSDAGRAVLTAAIPVAIWLDASAVVVILIVTAPVNALRVLFESTFAAAVPPLVGREHLGRAMSYLESVLSVPFIIGPALAGIMLVTVGPAATLAIDAASFAVSAVSLQLLRRRLVVEQGDEPHTLLSDIKAGLRFVVAHRELRSLIGYWCLASLATAGILPALSYYVTLDRELGNAVFGFVGSAWSVGYLVASLGNARMANRWLSARLVASGLVVGLGVLAFSLTGNLVGLLAAGFVVGAGLAVQLIAYATLRTSYTPDDLLGRVGSVARTATLGLQPLGVLGVGVALDLVDGQGTLLAMGLLSVVVAAGYGLVLATRPRDAGGVPTAAR